MFLTPQASASAHVLGQVGAHIPAEYVYAVQHNSIFSQLCEAWVPSLLQAKLNTCALTPPKLLLDTVLIELTASALEHERQRTVIRRWWLCLKLDVHLLASLG